MLSFSGAQLLAYYLYQVVLFIYFKEMYTPNIQSVKCHYRHIFCPCCFCNMSIYNV